MKKFFGRILGKLRAKILVITVIVFVISIIVLKSISYPILFRVLSRNVYEEQCKIASEVDSLIPESPNYYSELFNIAQSYSSDFEIVNYDNFLLYTSRGTGNATSTSHFASSSSIRAEYFDMVIATDYREQYKLDFENFEIKKKAAADPAYFIYHQELSSGDIIYVYSDVSNVENVVSITDSVYLAISLVAITFLCVIFIILVSRLSKPVEEMNEVTKDMAALDFGRKCNDYGNDEVGELGKSINILSDKLDETLADLKDKNIQLEKDIAMRLALDNARKDFISNVSHELKTPIAIISGYAEGVCEGISDDPEVIREYCKIIRDETNKMNGLVLELLELTKLESQINDFSPDYFDIGESVQKLLGHLSLQFEANGITVENNIPLSEECYAQGDKIEIVLKNYITNAISHCSGEKKIILSSKRNGKMIRINVFNSGNHISTDDYDNIWDSFYRGDKSHERSDSRFGLGLSIVKSIMTKHRCYCGAENVEGGVVFWFEVSGDSDYYEKNQL